MSSSTNAPSATLAADALTPGPQHAPRGPERTCRSWKAEAALRCLLNNLEADVAEDPASLIVYGGSGKAARDWESLRAIVRTLQRLEVDETLLVQSGRPVGVFKTTEFAPRVLIANSNLVGKWATWDHFRELEAAGKMMYGQMTAGSWIYIGSQGILQGTYETFAAAARRHFGGTLAKRLVVTAGLGGMGGAQPLAATMNEGTCLAADVDEKRIRMRLDTRYCDELMHDLDAAIDRALEWKEQGVAKSIGVVANAVDLLERLLERGVTPDVLTDQTSAHDPIGGYVPGGMTLEEALALRASDPNRYEAESFRTMREHVQLMNALQARGADTFDYGNNLRGHAEQSGLPHEEAFAFEGFVPKYVRPLFCEGKGPFRWVALTSRRPTASWPSCSPTTRRWCVGCTWRPNASPSRACRPASAGSATATARRPASRSTRPCARGASRPRSRSGATTSTAAPSRRPTARPRRCATGATRSPTGRS